MKQLSIYLLATTLMLFGSIKVTAQTECPDIEWMRFFNNDNNYSAIISHIDNYQNALVYGSYEGGPSLGNYNFPVASAAMQNTFVGKLDSTGNLLWVHTAKTFTYGYGSTIFSPSVDSSGYIYTTIDFKWKTEFGGVTYMGNTQKGNALFVKMSPQGQVLDTMLIKGLSDYFLNVFHVDENGNLYCYADLRNTLTIDGQTFVTNGGIDMLVFKLNSQFQLQWARQIGGTGSDMFAVSAHSFMTDTSDDIYFVGSFTSPTLTLGSFQLSNPYANTTGSSEPFIAKINSNGVFDWAVKLGLQDSTSAFSPTALALDSNFNVYLSGFFNGSLFLNNNPMTSFPVNTINGCLICYNPSTQQFSSMPIKGGNNLSWDVLFEPQRNMILLSGATYPDETIDVVIDTIMANDVDFYVLGIPVSTQSEKLTPEWEVHSHGNSGESFPYLATDAKGNIYLSGTYTSISGTNGAFDHYNFPSIPGNSSITDNGYQAKLGFLSREVTDSNGLLIAVQDSAIYQWLDCDNGLQPVAGATSQSFQPTQPGSYAVRVSNSFCSVVSECISTTGISESQRLRQTKAYPNPVRETLHLSHLPLGTRVSVFDVLGRAVYTTTAQNTKLDISARVWASGVYMLHLSKGGAAHLEKVVKE